MEELDWRARMRRETDRVRRNPERVLGTRTSGRCLYHPKSPVVLMEIKPDGNAVVACRVTLVSKKTGAKRQEYHCRRCLPLELAGVVWPGETGAADLPGANAPEAPAAPARSGYNGVPREAPPPRFVVVRRGKDNKERTR